MIDNYWCYCQEGFYFFYLFKLEIVNNSVVKKNCWKKVFNFWYYLICLYKKKFDLLLLDIFVEYFEF